MTQNSDGWDDFLADAERDDRMGKHVALVKSRTDGIWPPKDGYPESAYTKFALVLTTASNADLEMTYSKPPDEPPTKEELATWTKGRKLGVANAVSLRRQLAQFYGKTFSDLRDGDKVGVKVEGRKSKKDGRVYPRVVAFIPLNEASGPEKASTDDIPF